MTKLKEHTSRILRNIHKIDQSSILPIKYAIVIAITAFIVLSNVSKTQAESQEYQLPLQLYLSEQPVTTIYWLQSIGSWAETDDVEYVLEAISTIPTTTTTTTTTTVAPTTTTAPIRTVSVYKPGEPRCPQWWDTALSVGWKQSDLPIIDRIMFAESSCQPDAISPTKDYGLMQINRKVWQSYVEARGYVMEDLLDPAVGLMFGLFVAQEAESYGWCRYEPWHMSGNWC